MTIDEARDGVVVADWEVGTRSQASGEIHLVDIVANTDGRSARVTDGVFSSGSASVDEAVAGVAFTIVVEAIHVVVVGADRAVSSAVNGRRTTEVVIGANKGRREIKHVRSVGNTRDCR